MEKQGQVGVYKLYKLGRLSGNRFDTSIKVLDRDLHVVHHDYAEKINAQSEVNGLLYEYNEAASKLYWQKKPYKAVKEYTEFVEVEKEPELLPGNIDLLRAEYEALSGMKAHHTWKEKRLIEKIEELKN